MDSLQDIYQLEDCLDWIFENGFKRVVLQLRLEDLKNSVAISEYMKENSRLRLLKQSSTDNTIDDVDFYITRTNTCCLDLLVTQHATDIQAIIHFGNVCLSQPDIQNQESSPAVLYAFKRRLLSSSEISDRNAESIVQQVRTIRDSEPYSRICILYDTDLIDYAIEVENRLKTQQIESVDVAKLYIPNTRWYTTPVHKSKTVYQHSYDAVFGHFALKQPIGAYTSAIYLGSRLSIQLSLEGPTKLVRMDLQSTSTVDQINVSRLLNRRMALVSRIKDEEELKIGVIITNPLPKLDETIERLDSYSKPRKHTLYFISMIQTIDECKIGNFDLCDAFVVINSCTCSTILESLVFNRPIISELEYKLACGFEAEYGRVLWPGSSSHLTADDIINKRKVSDVSLALVQTRNELLERCSQARVNKWSGLEYKASGSNIGGGEGVCGESESLIVEEGLKGIASSYASEPLKKDVELVDKHGDNNDEVSSCCTMMAGSSLHS